MVGWRTAISSAEEEVERMRGVEQQGGRRVLRAAFECASHLACTALQSLARKSGDRVELIV